MAEYGDSSSETNAAVASTVAGTFDASGNIDAGDGMDRSDDKTVADVDASSVGGDSTSVKSKLSKSTEAGASEATDREDTATSNKKSAASSVGDGEKTNDSEKPSAGGMTPESGSMFDSLPGMSSAFGQASAIAGAALGLVAGNTDSGEGEAVPVVTAPKTPPVARKQSMTGAMSPPMGQPGNDSWVESIPFYSVIWGPIINYIAYWIDWIGFTVITFFTVKIPNFFMVDIPMFFISDLPRMITVDVPNAIKNFWWANWAFLVSCCRNGWWFITLLWTIITTVIAFVWSVVSFFFKMNYTWWTSLDFYQHILPAIVIGIWVVGFFWVCGRLAKADLDSLAVRLRAIANDVTLIRYNDIHGKDVDDSVIKNSGVVVVAKDSNSTGKARKLRFRNDHLGACFPLKQRLYPEKGSTQAEQDWKAREKGLKELQEQVKQHNRTAVHPDHSQVIERKRFVEANIGEKTVRDNPDLVEVNVPGDEAYQTIRNARLHVNKKWDGKNSYGVSGAGNSGGYFYSPTVIENNAINRYARCNYTHRHGKSVDRKAPMRPGNPLSTCKAADPVNKSRCNGSFEKFKESTIEAGKRVSFDRLISSSTKGLAEKISNYTLKQNYALVEVTGEQAGKQDGTQTEDIKDKPKQENETTDEKEDEKKEEITEAERPQGTAENLIEARNKVADLLEKRRNKKLFQYAIVYVHNYRGSPDDTIPFLEELCDNLNGTVLLVKVRLRFHGLVAGSEGLLQNATPENYMEDIVIGMNRARRAADRVLLMGFGFGATLCFLLTNYRRQEQKSRRDFAYAYNKCRATMEKDRVADDVEKIKNVAEPDGAKEEGGKGEGDTSKTEEDSMMGQKTDTARKDQRKQPEEEMEEPYNELMAPDFVFLLSPILFNDYHQLLSELHDFDDPSIDNRGILGSPCFRSGLVPGDKKEGALLSTNELVTQLGRDRKIVGKHFIRRVESCWLSWWIYVHENFSETIRWCLGEAWRWILETCVYFWRWVGRIPPKVPVLCRIPPFKNSESHIESYIVPFIDWCWKLPYRIYGCITEKMKKMTIAVLKSKLLGGSTNEAPNVTISANSTEFSSPLLAMYSKELRKKNSPDSQDGESRGSGDDSQPNSNESKSNQSDANKSDVSDIKDDENDEYAREESEQLSMRILLADKYPTLVSWLSWAGFFPDDADDRSDIKHNFTTEQIQLLQQQPTHTPLEGFERMRQAMHFWTNHVDPYRSVDASVDFFLRRCPTRKYARVQTPVRKDDIVSREMTSTSTASITSSVPAAQAVGGKYLTMLEGSPVFVNAIQRPRDAVDNSCELLLEILDRKIEENAILNSTKLECVESTFGVARAALTGSSRDIQVSSTKRSRAKSQELKHHHLPPPPPVEIPIAACGSSSASQWVLSRLFYALVRGINNPLKVVFSWHKPYASHLSWCEVWEGGYTPRHSYEAFISPFLVIKVASEEFKILMRDTCRFLQLQENIYLKSRREYERVERKKSAAEKRKLAQEEAKKKAEEDAKKAEEDAKKVEEDAKKAAEGAKKAEEDAKKGEEKAKSDTRPKANYPIRRRGEAAASSDKTVEAEKKADDEKLDAEESETRDPTEDAEKTEDTEEKTENASRTDETKADGDKKDELKEESSDVGEECKTTEQVSSEVDPSLASKSTEEPRKTDEEETEKKDDTTEEPKKEGETTEESKKEAEQIEETKDDDAKQGDEDAEEDSDELKKPHPGIEDATQIANNFYDSFRPTLVLIDGERIPYIDEFSNLPKHKVIKVRRIQERLILGFEVEKIVDKCVQFIEHNLSN